MTIVAAGESEGEERGVDDTSEDGEEGDDGDEVAGEHIRDALDWSSLGLTFSDSLHYVIQPIHGSATRNDQREAALHSLTADGFDAHIHSA